jgi:hypothetical protein
VTRALLAVLLAGCGFHIPGGSINGDGGIDGARPDGTLDADADAPNDGMPNDGPLSATCVLDWLNHTIAFDQGTPIATVNTTSFERDPFVSADEKTLWFSNGGATSQGGGDIFVATRPNLAAPFSAPVRDDAFSTSNGVESKMAMTTAQTFVVFASNMPGGAGNSDIYERSRPTTSAAWGQISRIHVMGLETSASELDPFVSPDGMHIYWAPTSPSPQHLMVAKRTSLTESFTSAAALGELNTSASECDPMVFADDRVIVFSSDRASQNASGNIWYATRQSVDDPFGEPVELPGVSSDLDDADAHVSADGCRIYFARNVGGGVDWELFSANAQ